MYHKVVKNNVEIRFGSQGTNWSLRFSNSGIIAFRLYPFPIGRFSDNVCSLSCEIAAVYFAFLNDFLALFFRSQLINWPWLFDKLSWTLSLSILILSIDYFIKQNTSIAFEILIVCSHSWFRFCPSIENIHQRSRLRTSKIHVGLSVQFYAPRPIQ